MGKKEEKKGVEQEVSKKVEKAEGTTAPLPTDESTPEQKAASDHAEKLAKKQNTAMEELKAKIAQLKAEEKALKDGIKAKQKAIADEKAAAAAKLKEEADRITKRRAILEAERELVKARILRSDDGKKLMELEKELASLVPIVIAKTKRTPGAPREPSGPRGEPVRVRALKAIRAAGCPLTAPQIQEAIGLGHSLKPTMDQEVGFTHLRFGPQEEGGPVTYEITDSGRAYLDSLEKAPAVAPETKSE